MKIEINPQMTQYSDFIKSVLYQFDKSGSVIHAKRNEVRIFDVNGSALIVKRFKVPHLANRIIYTFFRKSKAQRSYQYALRFQQMEIETPQPVAYIITKQGGLLHDSYFINMKADFNRTMNEFGEGGVEGRVHILYMFADFTASIHAKGILHKDYSPGNILFKEEDGKVSFCLVDINRLRFGKVSILKGCSNFARLWGQKPFFDIVIKKYAEIRGADYAQCMKTALKARKKYWKRYTRKYPWPFKPDDELNCTTYC